MTSRKPKKGKAKRHKTVKVPPSAPAGIVLQDLPPDTMQLTHVEFSAALLAKANARRDEDKARGVPGLTTFAGLMRRLLYDYAERKVDL